MFIQNNWLWEKYGSGLGIDPFDRGRYPTMQAALNLLVGRRAQYANIVETGCQREPDDIGAGSSTTVFEEYIYRTKGALFTIDNNEEHLNRAKSYKIYDKSLITYILNDSIAALKSFPEPIDLLYLDSFDYPYGELLDIYGGKEDINKAINILKNMPEDEIVKQYSNIILPCQQHTVHELTAATSKLHHKSIILIDDNTLPGGGKTRLAKLWLKENSWMCVLDYHQTLWIKKE